MEEFRQFLVIWAIAGFFIGSCTRGQKLTKKQALIQWIALGPFFWIGVPIMALITRVKG